MAEFSLNVDLKTLSCFTCGIVFAIPKEYRDNRYNDGATFYCPNRHNLAYPKRDNNGESSEERAERLHNENDDLKNRVAKLTSELDQAEAHLAEIKDIPVEDDQPLEEGGE
jgi:hypothetical protein